MGGGCHGSYSTPASNPGYGQFRESGARSAGGRPTTATSSVFAIILSFCSTSSGLRSSDATQPRQRPSADDWQELLEPVVKGYRKKGLRLLFRGDAAFGYVLTRPERNRARCRYRTRSGLPKSPGCLPGPELECFPKSGGQPELSSHRDSPYNGRGTAEQWIKEGKYALNWTRLSCHKFVANQVRLALELAYNPTS